MMAATLDTFGEQVAESAHEADRPVGRHGRRHPVPVLTGGGVPPGAVIPVDGGIATTVWRACRERSTEPKPG